ncbi:MAG: histidinol-phosphatase HisJ family protein [Prolixibacteraceae bacterium]|nr:histidinol-phosphatase HisJ family protein [Prolixibacteraceae bacterium]MBN2648316.1 histidinol-phosphatase HisJ family protein [Prolixibacteraceae bacterium]
MSFLVDYHMHTSFSDGSDTYPAYLEKARKKDLAEIGFTDHITLNPVDWSVQEIDYPVMKENLKSLCNDFSEDVQVRFGIEVDYFEGRELELKQLIAYFPADYVIGSVHFLGDWNFDTDRSLYGKWPNDVLYKRYFKQVQNAAKSGLFDVIGHFDLIKKLQCWPEHDQTELYEETLKILKEADVVMELNTSGIYRPCGEFFPNRKILEMAAKIGVPLTLGSDAHKPEQVARHFDQAVELLKETGYTRITRFRNRQRGEILL